METIKKIDKDTVEITEKKIIDLKPLRENKLNFETQANEITFLDWSKIKGLTEEMIYILQQENARRDELKSYFLEQARMKQEELNKYD